MSDLNSISDYFPIRHISENFQLPVIPIVIPAYQPDQRLLTLLEKLREICPCPVILVDDGSGQDYQFIFSKAKRLVLEKGGCLLAHKVNRGKGRALKTAFTYVCNNFPHAVGVVTADADGQHAPECILNTAKALAGHPQSLVLGVRSFSGEDVPWKSRVGNKLSSACLGYVCGIHTCDTQTGLRGIPFQFMRHLLTVKGDRFEFEMRMLLESAPDYPIFEVPIQTIYDSRDHHQTHFNPLSDTIRICRILGERFFLFFFSSISSSVLDLALFALFAAVARQSLSSANIVMATVLARIISSGYNYAVNSRLVFQGRASAAVSAPKYFLLAAGQMTVSAVLAAGFIQVLPFVSPVAVKACIDTGLFFISYFIQRRFIFS